MLTAFHPGCVTLLPLGAGSCGLLEGPYAGATRLAADREEEAAWRERQRSHGAASASASSSGAIEVGRGLEVQARDL